MDSSNPDPDADTPQESYEDQDTLKSGKQSLGLDRDYLDSWNDRDAFREFYQNLVDGIVETQGVPRTMIQTVTEDGKNDYIIKLQRRADQQILGFIRFSKKKGELQLTNYNARLSRKSLGLGQSSKRKQENLAGTHGEGFKVAALVLVRKQYQVRYESSSFYWNFQFGGKGKNMLYCHLTTVKDTKLQKLKDDYAKSLAKNNSKTLKANIWEDVTVRIGNVFGGTKGRKLELDTFLDWLTVAIDLDKPSRVTETSHGSLITDKRFSGKIYLKGLFLDTATSARNFKFGYNFSQGEINRDRQILADPEQEADILAKIWGEAIQRKKGLAKEYTTMLLQESSKNWADVTLAKDRLSMHTTSAIWDYLRKREVFYCGMDVTDQDLDIIKRKLNKVPCKLPLSIWEPLKKFNLVRNPEEQRHHLLYNASISSIDHTTYSQGIIRALSAVLALDTRTQRLKPIFKDRKEAELDLLLEHSSLFINDKWLDFQISHDTTPCWLSHLATAQDYDIKTFSCDHVVTDLYELILQELSKRSEGGSAGILGQINLLRLKVSENLRQMPRMVTTSLGQFAGHLQVSWTDPESEMVYKLHGLDLKCRITLHRESTCAQMKSKLLELDSFSENYAQSVGTDTGTPDNAVQGIAECGCPKQVVSQREFETTFYGLSPDEEYFPMIARTVAQAFFGLPPKSMRPQALGSSTMELNSASSTSAKTGSELNPKLEATQESSALSSPSQPTAAEQQLASVLEALHLKEQRLIATNDTLCRKEQELYTALEIVKEKEEELADASKSIAKQEGELRASNSKLRSERRQFKSRIEDLQGEVQALQESRAEIENDSNQLTAENHRLRLQVDELQANVLLKNSMASNEEKTTSVANQLQTDQLNTDNARLREENDNLAAAAEQARQDKVSMIATLQGVMGMIQGVLSLEGRDTIVSSLQGVLSMIQSVLNMGTRASPPPAATIKRERIKEEPEDEPSARAAKKVKQVSEVIELD